MKLLKFFSLAMMALAMSYSFVACGDDDEKDDNEKIVIPEPDQDPDPDVVLTPKEQKEKLEVTARNLISKIDASDFEEITDLVKSTKEIMDINDKDEDYSEAIQKWIQSAVELCEGNMTNNVQKNLYLAANFTGKFELQGNKWVNKGENPNALEFIYNDNKGINTVVKITASSKYTPIHHAYFDNERYDYEEEATLRYENTYGIPEKLTVTLTHNGKTLADATITTAFNSNELNLDLEKENYEITATINISGYQIAIDKVRYSGTEDNAYASITINKGNEKLISMQAEAGIKIRLVTDREYYYGEYFESTNFEVMQKDRVALNVDVLGDVRLIGEIKDADKLSNFLSAAADNDEDEESFKRNIGYANDQLNIGLYYDGKDTRMAKIELKTTAHKDYSYDYYSYEPAIVFNDKTSYTFENFFEKTYFKKVTDNFTTLIEDFNRLFR